MEPAGAGTVLHLPLVICVGCSPKVVARFRAAAARARIVVRACGVGDLADAVKRWRPVSVVVTPDTALGESTFDALAREGGVSLMVADAEMSTDEMAATLVASVFER